MNEDDYIINFKTALKHELNSQFEWNDWNITMASKAWVITVIDYYVTYIKDFFKNHYTIDYLY